MTGYYKNVLLAFAYGVVVFLVMHFAVRFHAVAQGDVAITVAVFAATGFLQGKGLNR